MSRNDAGSLSHVLDSAVAVADVVPSWEIPHSSGATKEEVTRVSLDGPSANGAPGTALISPQSPQSHSGDLSEAETEVLEEEKGRIEQKQERGEARAEDIDDGGVVRVSSRQSSVRASEGPRPFRDGDDAEDKEGANSMKKQEDEDELSSIEDVRSLSPESSSGPEVLSRKRKLSERALGELRGTGHGARIHIHRSNTHDPQERSTSPLVRPHRRAASTQSVVTNDQRNRQRVFAPGFISAANIEDYLSDSSSHDGSPHPSVRPRISRDRSNTAMDRGVGRPKKKHLDQHGRTVLARACDKGELDLVKELAEEESCRWMLEQSDNSGNMPLQIAALAGHADIVKYLIDMGCNVDCGNVDKDTPLIDAVENGHLEVVKILLMAGVDPWKPNQQGTRPLDLKPRDDTDREKIKEALIAAQQDPVHRRQSEDATALNDSRSASMGSPQFSPRLRSPTTFSGPSRRRPRRGGTESRPDLLYVSFNTETLRKFAGKGDVAGVDHLLNGKAKPDNSCMVAAAHGNHEGAMNILLYYGGEADPDPQSHDETPMLAAIKAGAMDIIDLLLTQEKFNPTRRDRNGKTYAEIARELKNPGWEQHAERLQKAFREYTSGKRALPKSFPSPIRSEETPRKSQLARSLTSGELKSSKAIGRATSPPDSRQRRNGSRPRKRSNSDNLHAARPEKPKRRVVEGRDKLQGQEVGKTELIFDTSESSPEAETPPSKESKLARSFPPERKPAAPQKDRFAAATNSFEAASNSSTITPVQNSKLDRLSTGPELQRTQRRPSISSRGLSKTDRNGTNPSTVSLEPQSPPTEVATRQRSPTAGKRYLAVDPSTLHQKDEKRLKLGIVDATNTDEHNSEVTAHAVERRIKAEPMSKIIPRKLSETDLSEERRRIAEQKLKEEKKLAEERRSKEEEQRRRELQQQQSRALEAAQAEERRKQVEEATRQEGLRAEAEERRRQVEEAARQEILRAEAEQRRRQAEEVARAEALRAKEAAIESRRLRLKALPKGIARALALGTQQPRERRNGEERCLRDWNPVPVFSLIEIDPECSPAQRQELWMMNWNAACLLGCPELTLEGYPSWEKLAVSRRQRVITMRLLRDLYTWDIEPYDHCLQQENIPSETYQERYDESKAAYMAMEPLFWVRFNDFLTATATLPHLKDFQIQQTLKYHIDWPSGEHVEIDDDENHNDRKEPSVSEERLGFFGAGRRYRAMPPPTTYVNGQRVETAKRRLRREKWEREQQQAADAAGRHFATVVTNGEAPAHAQHTPVTNGAREMPLR